MKVLDIKKVLFWKNVSQKTTFVATSVHAGFDFQTVRSNAVFVEGVIFISA